MNRTDRDRILRGALDPHLRQAALHNMMDEVKQLQERGLLSPESTARRGVIFFWFGEIQLRNLWEGLPGPEEARR